MMTILRNVLLLTAILALTSCATRLTKPKAAPQPALERFSTFERVVLKPMTINPKFAESGPNQSAMKKMDNYMQTQLAMVFSDVDFVTGDIDANSDVKTLVIEPRIKEIKFVNTAARIFAGAMAGGSAVLMDVTYTNTNSGQVISNPEFYADASAWSGWGADNKVLNRVIEDIVLYTKTNK